MAKQSVFSFTQTSAPATMCDEAARRNIARGMVLPGMRCRENDMAYTLTRVGAALHAMHLLNLSFTQANPLSLLDFGCGLGITTRFFSFCFGRVVGYEPNPRVLKAAKEAAPGLAHGDMLLTDDQARLGEHDVIVAISVLGHLDETDQMKALVIIRNAMKPGGRACLWYLIRKNRKALTEVFGSSFVPEDDRILAEHPDAVANVRVFDLEQPS